MSEMSRTYCGRAFQSVGPAMMNALLPAMVDRVNGTHSRLCSWERRPLDGTYGTIISCKYAGAVLCMACDHNFEMYARYDWQPVKILWDGRDMIVFPAAANKARSNVLDALELLDLRSRVSAE